MNTKFDELLIMCSPVEDEDGKATYTVCLSDSKRTDRKAYFKMPQMTLIESSDELPNPSGFSTEDVDALLDFIKGNHGLIDMIALGDDESELPSFTVSEEEAAAIISEAGLIEEPGYAPVFTNQNSSLKSQLSSKNMSNISGTVVV